MRSTTLTETFNICFQPLGKGLLQRLLLNLSAHSSTRAVLVHLLLEAIKPETGGAGGGLTTINSQRLYGCQSNIVYGRSQLFDGICLFLSDVIGLCLHMVCC